MLVRHLLLPPPPKEHYSQFAVCSTKLIRDGINYLLHGSTSKRTRGEKHPIFYPKSIPGLMAQAFPAECEVSISIVIIFKVPLLYKQLDIKKKKN